MTQGTGYECHKLDTQTQVFFYEQEFYVLSNFSSFEVKINGRTYKTSEHAYHAAKFYEVADGMAIVVYADVCNAPSAHEAFQIAQRHKQHRRKDWDDVKYDVMRNILWAKVTQHEYVRTKLLQTGDRELIEDSWRDDVWGWGPNHDGQNLLGKCWMEIRKELRIRA